MQKYTNEELCTLIRKGETWAVDELLRQNERFVAECAHKLYRAGRDKHLLSNADLDDLAQEGRIALAKAADTYNQARGSLFLTYAGCAVKAAMLDWLRENDRRFEMRYQQEHPDSLIIEYEYESENTNCPDLEMGENPYRMTPEQIYLWKEFGDELKSAINSLDKRTRMYLMYRYGFLDGMPHSKKEAVWHFHLRESWAKKTEEEGIKRLRKKMLG